MKNISKAINTTMLLTVLCMLGTNASYAGEAGKFNGSWVATGTADSLTFQEGREVALFRLSGHVNLKTEVGDEGDFWSVCVGLSDSVSGTTGRCTWRGREGQELYLLIEGKKLAEGSDVKGTIIGGTGKLSGVTGQLQFQWSSMQMQRGQTGSDIGGYARELEGEYQLP